MATYLDPIGSGVTSLTGAYKGNTPPPPPPILLPPVNLTLSQKTGQQTILTWQAPEIESGQELPKYLIYRNGSLVAEAENPILSYTDNSPSKNPDNSTCYHIIGKYSTGNSPQSETACIVLVTGVSLSDSNIELVKGEQHSLTAAVIPDNASDNTTTWTIDYEQAAAVNNGTVTAVGYGNANITVTTTAGNYTANCVVMVYNVPEGKVKATEAFSPNGGVNNYFIIERIEEYTDNELIVFDRSNTVHYRMKGYQNDWNGVANEGPHKGKLVPSGTYYYVLTAKNLQKDIKSFVIIKY
jgi:gliding motility-associated-like protein